MSKESYRLEGIFCKFGVPDAHGDILVADGFDTSQTVKANIEWKHSSKVEEDSMDEKRVKEAAKEFLIEEGYPEYAVKVPRTDELRSKCLARLIEEFEGQLRKQIDHQVAVAVVTDLDFAGDIEVASWYPDPKHKAKLILDECGVKTYEVGGLSEKHEGRLEISKNYYKDDTALQVTANVNSDSINGKSHIITAARDMPGDETIRLQNKATAKQALESLGYEVEE